MEVRLLLDTHIFMWWAEEPARLTPTALAALEDQANELILSAASVWEMQIKDQIGKLTLNQALPSLINSQRQTNGLQILAIELAHVLALQNLPLHHKDPFDRLIIAQAIVEDMTVVSADTKFSSYSVKLLT
jgi:PIN domain nuclease of toxin-antitoxin system